MNLGQTNYNFLMTSFISIKIYFPCVIGNYCESLITVIVIMHGRSYPSFPCSAAISRNKSSFAQGVDAWLTFSSIFILWKSAAFFGDSLDLFIPNLQSLRLIMMVLFYSGQFLFFLRPIWPTFRRISLCLFGTRTSSPRPRIYGIKPGAQNNPPNHRPCLSQVIFITKLWPRIWVGNETGVHMYFPVHVSQQAWFVTALVTHSTEALFCQIYKSVLIVKYITINLLARKA